MSVVEFFRSPASPRVVIIAFAAHLIAWSGFVAVKVAAESIMPGEGVLTAAVLLALAWIAAAAAIVVARGLGARWFRVVAVVSLVVFGLAGVAEVAYRSLPLPYDNPLWLVMMPFAYVGVLAMPLALTAAAVLSVGRSRSVSNPPAHGETLAAGAAVFACALAVTGVTTLQFAGIWYVDAWVTSGCAIIGVVAALLVLDRVAHDPARGQLRLGVRVCVSFIVLYGTHLAFLSAIQAVFSDAIGIGGGLLLMVALPGFVTGSIALTVLLVVSMRVRR